VVTYVSSGTWPEHDLHYTLDDPAQLNDGTWQNTVGQTSGGNTAGGPYSLDATTSGTVTVTLQWYPTQGETMAQDPPCSQMLIQEDAYAYAFGGTDNGLDDTWSTGLPGNEGTAYSVHDSHTGTVTVSDNLIASTPIAPGPPYDAGAAEVAVTYSVAYTPVEVDLSGTTLDGDTLKILTGQQVVATFSSVSNATSTVSNWIWSTAGGDPFLDYISGRIATAPPCRDPRLAARAVRQAVNCDR